MEIKFNQEAYDAFKANFTFLNPSIDKMQNFTAKLIINIPIISTIFAFRMFNEAGKAANRYESIAWISRGVLSLIPGVNLSIYVLQGLGTIVAVAIDGVRDQIIKSKLDSEQ